MGPILTKSREPVPDKLRNWLSRKAENNVIYVSMGTTAYIPRETVQVLVNGIMSTNYSAVWSLKEDSKFALESLHIDRSRMFVSKWLPQLAVLQHSAVGLAIFHGGLGSLQEAFTNGVPVLVLPFTAEQRANSARVHSSGVGISLNPSELTAAKVFESLKQIDSDVYREAVRKLQKVYTHRREGLRGLQIWRSSMRRSGMNTWFQPMPSMSGAGCSTTMWMCMP